MSTCLSAAKRAVQPRHPRRGHDVDRRQTKADSFWDQTEQEDQPDEAEEDDEGDADGSEEISNEADAEDEADAAQASGGDKDQLSLPELAEEIRQAHACCEQLQGRAMASALRAGKLLFEARKRVRHGEWAKWLKRKARLSQRTYQRYIKLIRSESKLDALDPSWRAEWSLSQAINALTEPTDQEDSADEQSDGDAAGDMDGEWATEEAEADLKSTSEPAATAAEDRREARSLFRRCVAYLPEFFKAATHWKFRARSPEQTALEQLEQALVRAARDAARPLRSTVVRRSLTPDMQAEVVAMALVQKLLEKGQVKKLFRPAA